MKKQKDQLQLAKLKLRQENRRYCPVHLRRTGTAASPGVCSECGASGETRQAGRAARRASAKADMRPGRVNYLSYMDSAAWRKKREERIAIDGGRCMDCGASGRLHVHHLSYRRLGYELMGDLVTVCHSCHETRHGRAFGRSSQAARRAEKKARRIHRELDAEFRARLERD